MKVFRVDAELKRLPTLAAIQGFVAGHRYAVAGRSHSYNGIQLVPGVPTLLMSECGLHELIFDPDTQVVRVGASVSIEAVKRFLLIHRRRLRNSGNYMKQTLVGAISTGTHGYGLDAMQR